MKKLAVCLTAVLLFGCVHIHAAVSLPSVFAPIRSAIADQLAALTNNPAGRGPQARQMRLLRQARRTLDRPGRPSLFGDVQILAGLANSLTRAFPDAEFDLLLQVAVADLQDALRNATVALSNTVAALPPSGSTINASNTLAEVMTSLDQLDPAAGVAGGVQTLSRAAVRLRSVEGLLSRARTTTSRGDRMTATAGNTRFQAEPGAHLSAIYNPAVQFLTISGTQVSGPPTATRTIKLFIANVVPGTTTHSFGSPATGTYAIYSFAATNSGGFTSSSGTAIVTLDAVANVVSGRFDFSGIDEPGGGGPDRVTAGQFFIHLK